MSFPTNVGTLSVYAGDTFSQTFTFKEDGSAIDLVDAGWSAWTAQYRKNASSTTAVSFAVDTSAAASGQITISLSATQTANLESGVFDLQATQGSLVRTWIAGGLSVTKDVTRA
jgi:hypothetical protein